MFFLAVLLGIYGYGIFALGIFGILYAWIVGIWTFVILSLGVWYERRVILNGVKDLPGFSIKSGMTKTTLILLFTLAIVNLVGALGPETSFDALWYHLTFPKLYIQNHAITFIPGGLLYYSAMPKLGELFFVPALVFGNEIFAKGVQYVFGILTAVAIYKISRRYVAISLSLLACLVFYSNILVAWESTVAYIDLIRTFYEIMAVWALLLWSDTRKKTWLYLSAIMLGFAISTKLLALGSLLIFTILIVYSFWNNKKTKLKYQYTSIPVYWFISLGIVLPWFIFSYIYTGNPVYPFFTAVYPIGSYQNILSLQTLFADLSRLFLFSPDPISPIYLIIVPLVVAYFTKFKPDIKMLAYYALLTLLVWYITPRTGGGRFILPYLPAWSILVIAVLDFVKQKKIVHHTILISIFYIACLTILYRGAANSRYMPVILGFQTKEQFLVKNLNYSFGDFYDTDGYFAKHIKPTDRVLLYGFHNLYYVNFPFIHSSWVKKGDTFTHIATQDAQLPVRFSDWDLIYENNISSVRLYTKGNTVWQY